MSKTVDISLSLRTKQYFVAAGVSGFVALPVFGAILVATGLPTDLTLVGAVTGWLLLTLVWVRRLGGEDADGTWDAIPAVQRPLCRGWRAGPGRAGSGSRRVRRRRVSRSVARRRT